ncbi:MAG: peptidylprolyl isomerase [Blastocatellia bacterium]|nr:peptidylprolyl isomerase [Blastocatellia bacterium]
MSSNRQIAPGKTGYPRFSMFLSFCLGVVFVASALGQEPQVVDETIARVNRDLITRSLYDSEVKKVRDQLERDFPNDKPKQDEALNKLKPKILPSLIEEKLISQRADELGINVEAEINQQIIALCKENKIDSLTDCQTAMEREGLSLDSIKANLRTTFQRRAVLSQEVFGPTLEKITEKEKRDFYEANKDKFIVPGEVKLFEIYVSFKAETQAQAETRIRQALDDLKAGKDFGATARRYSDDNRASRLKDGEMPSFKENELSDWLKKEVDKIKPGQYTSIIKLQNAYQIFKLESRIETKPRSFEEMAPEIAYNLAYEKSSDKFKVYIAKLRKQSFVVVREEFRGQDQLNTD